jgi:GNAT superfamily N-acetyltransferase
MNSTSVRYEVRLVRDDSLIEALGGFSRPETGMRVILFGGDRATCCDESIVALSDEGVVGAAALSPMGEAGDGTPTIVGLYVRPSCRRRGIGMELMKRAVERMEERGLVPVRVDPLMRGSMELVARLPEPIRSLLTVVDSSVVWKSEMKFL